MFIQAAWQVPGHGSAPGVSHESVCIWQGRQHRTSQRRTSQHCARGVLEMLLDHMVLGACSLRNWNPLWLTELMRGEERPHVSQHIPF